MLRARASRIFVDYQLHLALVILGALMLLVGLTACMPDKTSGAGKAETDGPRLSFQEREHDFGQISASQKVEYRFAFTNTGVRPLEISDIRREPAKPGG